VPAAARDSYVASVTKARLRNPGFDRISAEKLEGD